MQNGSTLTQQPKLELCAPVTTQEVNMSLHTIGVDKAPGIGGYNATFFKKTWPIIQHDVVVAVKKFFITGKLFKVANCATITLIPKVDKPKTIKDFRSIARCSILYKLISKILASRL